MMHDYSPLHNPDSVDTLITQAVRTVSRSSVRSDSNRISLRGKSSAAISDGTFPWLLRTLASAPWSRSSRIGSGSSRRSSAFPLTNTPPEYVQFHVDTSPATHPAYSKLNVNCQCSVWDYVSPKTDDNPEVVAVELPTRCDAILLGAYPSKLLPLTWILLDSNHMTH